MEQLSETIQVGGARYALGGRSYPGFKGRKHFQQDFDALPDTERLFRTYFDVDPLSERQSMLPRFQRVMDRKTTTARSKGQQVASTQMIRQEADA